MGNEFTKIAGDVGHGIEVAVKDVVEIPKFVVKAAAVLGTAIKDQPEVKNVLTTLVSKAEAITASGALDVSQKGLNLISDAATIALVQDFFTYVKTAVVPMVESIYEDVKSDVELSGTIAPSIADEVGK